MKLRDANLQVSKNSHPLSSILSIFSQNTSSKESLKVCEHNFFQEIEAASNVTSNLPAQLRYFLVNFLHVELWHLLFF